MRKILTWVLIGFALITLITTLIIENKNKMQYTYFNE